MHQKTSLPIKTSTCVDHTKLVAQVSQPNLLEIKIKVNLVFIREMEQAVKTPVDTPAKYFERKRKKVCHLVWEPMFWRFLQENVKIHSYMCYLPVYQRVVRIFLM